MKKLFLIFPIMLVLYSCTFWGATNVPQIWFADLYFNENYTDIVCFNNYCYIASGPNGLRILDISDPSDCKEITGFTDLGLEEIIHSTSIEGEIGVILSNENIKILDFSNASSPVMISSVAVSGTQVFVRDDLLFVNEVDSLPYTLNTSVSETDFVIYDIADPLTPMEISRISGLNISNFIVSGDQVCYINTGQYFKILDISDITSPEEMETNPIKIYGKLVSDDNYVYLNSGTVIYSIDISISGAPVLKGRYYTGTDGNMNGNFAVSGNSMIFLAGNRVSLLNISDPVNITDRGDFLASFRYLGLSPGDFLSVDVYNENAFILSEHGFYIVSMAGY